MRRIVNGLKRLLGMQTEQVIEMNIGWVGKELLAKASEELYDRYMMGDPEVDRVGWRETAAGKNGTQTVHTLVVTVLSKAASDRLGIPKTWHVKDDHGNYYKFPIKVEINPFAPKIHIHTK